MAKQKMGCRLLDDSYIGYCRLLISQRLTICNLYEASDQIGNGLIQYRLVVLTTTVMKTTKAIGPNIHVTIRKGSSVNSSTTHFQSSFGLFFLVFITHSRRTKPSMQS